jgi:hypothetical protein
MVLSVNIVRATREGSKDIADNMVVAFNQMMVALQDRFGSDPNDPRTGCSQAEI